MQPHPAVAAAATSQLPSSPEFRLGVRRSQPGLQSLRQGGGLHMGVHPTWGRRCGLRLGKVYWDSESRNESALKSLLFCSALWQDGQGWHTRADCRSDTAEAATPQCRSGLGFQSKPCAGVPQEQQQQRRQYGQVTRRRSIGVAVPSSPFILTIILPTSKWQVGFAGGSPLAATSCRKLRLRPRRAFQMSGLRCANIAAPCLKLAFGLRHRHQIAVPWETAPTIAQQGWLTATDKSEGLLYRVAGLPYKQPCRKRSEIRERLLLGRLRRSTPAALGHFCRSSSERGSPCSGPQAADEGQAG